MRLSDDLAIGVQHLDVSVTEGFRAVPDARTPTDGRLELRVVQDVPPAVRLVAPEPECSPGDQDSVVREVDQMDELLAMDLLALRSHETTLGASAHDGSDDIAAYRHRSPPRPRGSVLRSSRKR